MPNNPLFNVLACLAVVGAGISVAIQQVLNARLRVELGASWWAGLASYVVGALVMIAAVTAFGEPRLTGAMVGRTSWPSWTGGVFGAIFVATGILMVPRLGAATVLALIVLGQMIGSLTIDHFGLLGVPQQTAGADRLAGAALLILGVILVRR